MFVSLLATFGLSLLLQQVINLFSKISEHGQIDCVIFNIGANVFFPIKETTARVFKKVWEMATFAGFLVGRESAKHMKNNGTIIFTGATASINYTFDT